VSKRTRGKEGSKGEATPPDPARLSLGTYGYILSHARANPLRAGATVTAVAVAVTFLIIVSSIAVGLEGSTERELLDYTLGTPELPISDFIQTRKGDFVGLFSTRLYDGEDVNAVTTRAQTIMGSATDVKVYPYTERVLGRSHFSGLEHIVQRLIGVDPQRGLTTPYTGYHDFAGLSNGEHLSDIDAREVVLGYQLWQERFPDAVVGSTIDLVPEGTAWYEVEAYQLRSTETLDLFLLDGLRGLTLKGVLDRDLSTDQNAFVPLGLIASETGAGTTSLGPRCEAMSVEVTRPGTDLQALALALRTEAPRTSSYFVTGPSQATETTGLAEDLRSSIYGWLVLAEAVILVGMVLGVANTTFLSVNQRMREIGTLRALGLSREQVRRLVQWEALFLGMMGGAIGFFAGHILTSSVINVLFEIEDLGIFLAPGRTVPVVVLLSILAVLVATLVGAWVPARKAASLSPVDALSAPE
jgi:ABC-type lipoprotein release transport system permease subunit